MSGRRPGRWIRHWWPLPADLAVVLALVVVTQLVVVRPAVTAPLVRPVLAIVFVLFVPGYALVAALFPEAGRSPAASGDHDGSTTRGRTGGSNGVDTSHDRFFSRGQGRARRGIDGIERAALAFGLSIALVPLLLVGLSLIPMEFAFARTFHVIFGVTVALTVIAGIRRLMVPADRRFRVPYRAWTAAGTRSITAANSRLDAVVTVALAVAILLAVGTFTSTVVAPPDGERFTEFYIVTEGEQGELVAADYPQSLTPGQPEQLQIGIENYERETIEYAVVVQLQQVEETPDDSVVAERAEVDRFSMTLAHNETSIRGHELTVSDELTGDDLRLMLLLYEGSVPETPTRDNAYRSLHLWVDVPATE